jgi:hypothetical protein
MVSSKGALQGKQWTREDEDRRCLLEPDRKRVFEWKENIQEEFNETCFGTELTDIKIKPNGGVS